MDKQAMQQGLDAGTVSERNIYGYVDNGLKFEGFIDINTSKTTNFTLL